MDTSERRLKALWCSKNTSVIKVLLFASLRERCGLAALDIPAKDAETRVADIWTAVQTHCNTDLSQSHVLVAVNRVYANMDAPVADGDEVAFFPPVTGG